MKRSNCSQCGAPLPGRKCGYCGTVYVEDTPRAGGVHFGDGNNFAGATIHNIAGRDGGDPVAPAAGGAQRPTRVSLTRGETL